MATETIRARFRTQGGVPRPDFRKALTRANYRSFRYALADAKRRFAPHDRTGRTDAATGGVVEGSRGFRLENPTAPALFIEEGTGLWGPDASPYEILPVGKGALFWPGAEHPVARVIHPGIEPDPFLRPAIEENAGLFEEFIDLEIAREWERSG